MLTNITIYVDLEGSSYVYTGSNAVISDYENEARTVSYINLDDYSSYTKKVVIKNSRRETYTATLDGNNSFTLLDGHLSEGKLLLQLYMYFGDVQIRDNTIIKLNVLGSLNNSTEIEAGTTLATEIQTHMDDITIHFEDAPEDDTIYGRINGEWEIVGGSGGSTVWGTIGGTLSNQTDLQTALNNKSNTSHTHTEYASISHNHIKADITDFTHTHTESDISDLQDYALSNHNHDTEYSAITHIHDDRYYTETEVNTLLSGKSDTTHTHTDLHTHSNKALLDSLTSGGDGNSFLANDGTYKAVSSGSASWGSITGTLSNQTDLQTALNGKANSTHTHVESDITDLGTYLTDAPSDSNTYGRNNGSWVQVSGTGAVDSVNGQTGVVVLDADDIDDTSTTNKFISQAELTKLAGIEAGAQVNVVTSVNTQTGAVVLDSDDISEGITNLYLSGNEFQKNTDDMDDITNGTTYVKTENNYTDAAVTKLAGIETGAEVNNISDTNVTTLTGGSSADTLHKHAQITEQRASTQMKVWYGTTAQYTAIGTKDANTIYFCSQVVVI